VSADHAARFRRYTRLVDQIASYLQDVSDVQSTRRSFTMAEELVPEPVNCLLVNVGSADRARRIDSGLRAGNPAIYVHVRDDALIIDVEVVTDEQASMIGARLREEITADAENRQPAATAGGQSSGDGGQD
jgi:hypothetical protein